MYILGDLFEIWIGDDELDAPFPSGIAQAIRRLVDSGTPVAIMHGNRDFLLGPDFMSACGATLLPDPSVIDLFGQPTLLMHGDTLCTDDQAYQAFRRQVRDPAFLRDYLSKPIAERRAIAKMYRDGSRDAQSDKAMAIMDVNAGAVREALRESGCRRLIHGHTHRPSRHAVMMDGTAGERWVLSDWYGDRGGYLVCGETGCETRALTA